MERDANLVAAEAAWSREGLEEIPVLDLGPYLKGEPGTLEKLAAQLRIAQENIGFFYIKNHGVAADLIEHCFAEHARFFDQALDAKMSALTGPELAGYLPMKGSTIKSSTLSKDNKPDLTEAFWVRNERDPQDPDVLAKRRFHAPNVWPAQLPGFREVVLEYMAAVTALGKSMLPIYARALELPAQYFDDKFKQPHTSIRLGFYPAVPAEDDNQFGVAPHTDVGFLTLLPPAEVPGLQILTQSGKWLPAPGRPGHMLVNGGDSLARLTNGRFLATPHRVVPGQPKDRHSISFFFNPGFDAQLAPVETCIGRDRPARFPRQSYFEYLSWYVETNYPKIAKAA